MKDILLDYAQYNLWANKKIKDFLLSEGEELMDQELKSSFKSIKLTIFHMWDAEVIWLKRLQGESLQEWPSKSIMDSSTGFLKGWISASVALVGKVNEMSDEELNKEITYKNMKGDEFSQKIYQVLMHLFNHGTYHRGQLITMIRNAGVTQGIPQTDLIAYYRSNQ